MFFSLFLTVVLFILAIIVTNNTMIQATGLSPDKNLISVERIGEFVINKTGEIVHKVQEIDIKSLKQDAEQILKGGISFFKSLKDGWDSL